MAVRCDAVGDYLHRTTDLPDNEANYTWMVLVNRNALVQYDCAMSIGDTSTSMDSFHLSWSSPDDCALFIEPGSDGPSVAYTFGFGVWKWVVMRRSSTTNCVGRVYGLDGAQLATCTSTVSVAGRAAVTAMRLGSNVLYGDRLNGKFCGSKFWTRSLSDAEIVTETSQLRPVSTDSLYEFWPILIGERTRGIYNNRNFTEAGTLTDEDGPFVPFGGSAKIFPFQGAAAGGANPKGPLGNPFFGPFGGPI